ncbi:MAG: hypothetical protein JSS62_00080 [Verrucomicrobia bacterium]|nr:hypothetical protein [Verrucomicrobiota bacterium]MBS0646533.1 hypothetical protein [Verrucomicrobiota bacterium]
MSSLGGPENSQFNLTQYIDDWQGDWGAKNPVNQQTPGVKGETGFAVVQSDGSFNPQYSISPVQGQAWNYGATAGNTALAIGGWTNSQPPSGGLWQVLQPTDPSSPQASLSPAAQNLINNICNNVGSNSPQGENYQTVTLDYESFASTKPGQIANVNAFVQELSTRLGQLDPPVKLEMAISPLSTNQQYFTLSAVTPYVSTFQVMNYDYAVGNANVADNASVSQTISTLKDLVSEGVPESKISVGVPFYGRQFEVAKGLTQAEVEQQLQSGRLQVTGSQSPITDDDILNTIGDWNAPQSPWINVQDGESPPGQFYYNSDTGTIISAMNPKELESLATAIKENFPGVNQAFGYEGYGDQKAQMVQQMIQDFNG